MLKKKVTFCEKAHEASYLVAEFIERKKANSNSWCTLNNTVWEITVSAQWEAQDKRQLSVRRNLGKDIIIPSSKGKKNLF